MNTLGKRLKALREREGLTQVELAKKLNISNTTLSQYESSTRVPSDDIKILIADYFKINLDYLLGRKDIDFNSPLNIFPLKTKVVPLVGEIVAGKPKYANEEFQYFIEIDDVIRADFCLKVKGDSMINARIYEGDIVFIRKQPDVEDGEIAAVRIDDEATLKRVYKMPGRVQLRAENPHYDPIDITEEDHKDVEILGKAVAFQSRVR